jgi:predicted nuclease with TOPRIM domain
MGVENEATEPLQQPGLEALRKERERADAAEKLLKELQGKIQSGDVLAGELTNTKALLAAEQKKRETELSSLQKSLSDKEKAIAQLKIEQAFNRAAAAAKLNPTYNELFLKGNFDQFVVGDAGVLTTDGKSIDDWITNKKSELPQLFLAPDVSGSGMSPASKSPATKKAIPRDDANSFMSNLDAIASGEMDTV